MFELSDRFPNQFDFPVLKPSIINPQLSIMSAYGAITTRRGEGALPSTKWYSKFKDSSITIHHLTIETAKPVPGLVEYLSSVFSAEVEAGFTYPQEGPYDQAAFEAYFFAADAFVAILDVKANEEPAPKDDSDDAIVDSEIIELSSSTSIIDAANGRPWNECVMGYYYVCGSVRSLARSGRAS